jgi:hypothetical protein
MQAVHDMPVEETVSFNSIEGFVFQNRELGQVYKKCAI